MIDTTVTSHNRQLQQKHTLELIHNCHRSTQTVTQNCGACLTHCLLHIKYIKYEVLFNGGVN